MGLIKAAFGSFNGTMADQWKEFFVCESLDQDVLAVKGQKKTSGRSANKKGNDNLITSGSGIAVADGQCALIVEQGRIAEVCAEPENTPMMHRQNRQFLQAIFQTPSEVYLRRLGNVSPMVEIRRKTRECIISIQKN